jgi:hypothetical protein
MAASRGKNLVAPQGATFEHQAQSEKTAGRAVSMALLLK